MIREAEMNAKSIEKKRRKLIYPIPRGGHRKSSSAFPSRRPYLQPSGQVTVDLKLRFQSDLSRSQRSNSSPLLFSFLLFSAKCGILTDHTTKLGMKGLLTERVSVVVKRVFEPFPSLGLEVLFC